MGLVHGEEDTLHGDSGYIGAQKRPEAIVKNKNRKTRYRGLRKQTAKNYIMFALAKLNTALCSRCSIRELFFISVSITEYMRCCLKAFLRIKTKKILENAGKKCYNYTNEI